MSSASTVGTGPARCSADRAGPRLARRRPGAQLRADTEQDRRQVGRRCATRRAGRPAVPRVRADRATAGPRRREHRERRRAPRPGRSPGRPELGRERPADRAASASAGHAGPGTVTPDGSTRSAHATSRSPDPPRRTTPTSARYRRSGTAQVQHRVERARGLRGDGLAGHPGQGGERLEPRGHVGGGVGVHGGAPAVVAGVQRGEHLADLGAAALPEHDPVGPHAQRVPDEVGQVRPRPAPSTFACRASSRTTCGCAGRELAGLLDDHEPLVVRDQREQRREQRRLARARRPRDQQVRPRRDERADHRHERGRERPGRDELRRR